jgi:hypothetical protein
MKMSSSQVFYQTLVTNRENANPYWQSLILITRATRSQLGALASDLAWQTWGAESKPTAS